VFGVIADDRALVDWLAVGWHAVNESIEPASANAKDGMFRGMRERRGDAITVISPKEDSIMYVAMDGTQQSNSHPDRLRTRDQAIASTTFRRIAF